MEDPRWLRLITIGLVLAALAVGYFLLTGRLSPNSTTRTQTQVNKAVESPTPNAVPGVTPPSSPTPTPASAYSRIVERTQDGVKSLPKTGFPQALLTVISIGVMISGLGLRKFPY
ncbi:hypothetical protein HYS96_01805 [Candidatus Daviesbacteria bacterium]|nr:hypothetical protein [Candidatus Daviesbacteria bacterium]